jgi:AcrR family transcriptional regulator
MAVESHAPRRRRTRAQAHAEILAAAGEILATRPAHEVTVAAVMAATTLTRKSFYVYFRDRAGLIADLVRPLRADADAALAGWAAALDRAEPPESITATAYAALAAAAHVYREHGAVLRALFWSAVDDPELAEVRRALADPVIALAERTLRTTDPATDPAGIANALVTMNIHSLLTLKPDTPDPELDKLVDVLATIWTRTIYPGGRDS